MTQREIQHLYLRAGFGVHIETLLQVTKFDRERLVNLLFEQSRKPVPIQVVRIPNADEMQVAMKKEHTPEEKKMLKEYSKDEGKNLNLAWLKKIFSGEEMLNEKMTFFWHDHFACKDNNPLLSQSLNNAIRKNALGNFKELLSAVSKEPAMLKFLNNQQNRKSAPNENFAREVMELFTLGRGHYTELDIKSAARAFTGWGFNRIEHSFEFKEKQHDYGEKNFLGAVGDFKGDDILRIITEQKQCALFITDKIYRYFVNEAGNDSRVAQLATDFYNSNYDIGALMHTIYTADWFYESQNMGIRIKSPIELMASLARQFEPIWSYDTILIKVQRILGQTLFEPPNVAGWANGKEWIDSSSLIFRMSLGKKLIDSTEMDVLPKPDNDKTPNEVLKKGKGFAQLQASIPWSILAKQLSPDNTTDLISHVSNYLLQSDLSKTTYSAITLSGGTIEENVKKLCSIVTALPEYQLC